MEIKIEYPKMKISSENEILDCIRLETLKINIPAHSDLEKD